MDKIMGMLFQIRWNSKGVKCRLYVAITTDKIERCIEKRKEWWDRIVEFLNFGTDSCLSTSLSFFFRTDFKYFVLSPDQDDSRVIFCLLAMKFCLQSFSFWTLADFILSNFDNVWVCFKKQIELEMCEWGPVTKGFRHTGR